MRQVVKELLVSAFLILHFAFFIPLSAYGADGGELLYFMVDAFDVSGPKNFDYAMIGVADSNGQVKDGSGDNVYLCIRPNRSESAAPDSVIAFSDPSRYTTNPQWAEFGEYASEAYSFYVETYAFGTGDDDTPIWSYDPSSVTPYAALLAANHVYFTNSTAEQNPAVWTIPEPSGSVLLLMGLAVLGLRRKKVKSEE